MWIWFNGWFIYNLYYYLRSFPVWYPLFFCLKIPYIPLCLSRDKTKGQSSKNTALTHTKTLPKKYAHSPVDFQITLSTYKLDYQNKNYI